MELLGISITGGRQEDFREEEPKPDGFD